MKPAPAAPAPTGAATRGGEQGERTAAVAIPELPLQLLLHDRPRWRGAPVAVVERSGPDAPLVHVSEPARRARVRVGMRAAAARNLCPDLRIGAVPPSRVRHEMQALAEGLQTFSPRVEPADRFEGAFFLDPEGLEGLYGGYAQWATAVHGFLKGRRLRSTVAVGFERYRALLLARSSRSEIAVLASAREERERSDAIELDHLEMSVALRDGLRALGVHELGELLALPAGELQHRFGEEAGELHGLFVSQTQLPMQPLPFDEPVRVTLSIEPPDDSHERLLFAIKGALHELMRGLALRNEALGALRITLGLEEGQSHRERIEPANGTRDELTLLELVRLRLARVTLARPVEHLTLEAESTAPEAHQLRLGIEARSKSDPGAAGRALARLRAAWGPDAVTRARVREAHLPEASFVWEPIATVSPPHPSERDAEAAGAEPATLVRRVLARPRPLPARSARDPETGPRLPRSSGDLLKLYGPYRVSGAWWVREVERDYYYAETDLGELLWLYYDRPRQRWFLQGMVD